MMAYQRYTLRRHAADARPRHETTGSIRILDDHETICAARNHLADALKTLLKPEIMGAPEFLLARNQTQMAMNELNRLMEMALLRT